MFSSGMFPVGVAAKPKTWDLLLRQSGALDTPFPAVERPSFNILFSLQTLYTFFNRYLFASSDRWVSYCPADCLHLGICAKFPPQKPVLMSLACVLGALWPCTGIGGFLA